MRIIRICLLGTAGLCAFMSAATADENAPRDMVLAQVSTPPNTAGSTPGGSAIESITVTAQRRSEDVQRVPVAITALEGSTLDTQGIVGFQDLGFRVPSLRFGAGVTGGENVITMRGLGSQNTTPGGDSPVAYSVDGVPLQRSTAVDPEFYDIDRIEVLRGPQGTLYGRNSVGGSINVLTNRPQDEFGASLDFLGGDYAAHIVRGYVTGPIVDSGDVQVLGRFTGVYAQHDPYSDNLSQAPTATHNQDAEDLYMLRGELQFNLSPSVNLLLTASTVNSRDPVATNVAWWETPTRYIVPGAPLPGMPPQPPIPLGSRCDFSTPQKFDPRKFCHDWHESASNKLDLFTGTLNWDLGFATLTSVTGYSTDHVHQSSDGDGSDLPMAAGQLWTLHQRQLSEEVRLASHESDSPLSWLGGFIYFYAANYENFIYFDTGYNDYYTAPPFSGYTDAFHFHNGGNSITKAWAPFGQVDFDFAKTDAAFPLTLSLGLRYSHDERISAGFLDYALPVLGLDFPQTFGFDKAWSQWTGNLTARYQFTPDVMGYATVARGYLSGGGIVGLSNQYNPEHVWSYEIGLKSQWLDNRLQLNAAAYHEDISNMQVFIQSGVTSGVENAAKSRANGLELEAVAIPVDNLRLNATLTLTDAKYEQYLSRDTRFSVTASPCFDPVTNPDALCNFKDNKLNQTPPYTFDLGAEYTFITSIGNFTPRAEVFFSGEVYFTPPNNPLARQSPYHQTDLHLTWNSVDNRWWADAFVKNLENKDVISNDGLQSSSLGLGVQEPDNYAYYPPRTFGLRVGVHL